MSVKSIVANCVMSALDKLDIRGVTVDVSIATDSSAVVQIIAPPGMRDEVDDVLIYDELADNDMVSDIDIEIEVIDEEERDDALEGAEPRENDDDEEEEDELSADNLTVIEEEDDYYTEEDEDEDDDEDDYSTKFDEDLSEEIDGIDSYEPTWEDLDEMTREFADYEG